MKIALVGYGKMGRMIDRLSVECGCEVVVRFDIDRPLNQQDLRGVGAAIEFTQPESALENIRFLQEAQIPTVVGTTGWYQHLSTVAEIVNANQGSLVWAANFSIGVNVFSKVLAQAAAHLAKHQEYGAYAWEVHHDAKKDAPSGTLLRLVDAIQSAGFDRPVDVGSNRAGFYPGTHEVAFDSPEDTITLRHTARSREGFARGALHAARLIGSKKGMFEFPDLLFGDPS
jgi:4-hydroxy-tetrahydrodipicolinate reductase